MEEIYFKEDPPAADLHQFQTEYNELLNMPGRTRDPAKLAQAQFCLGHTLIKCQNKAQVKQGINLLKELYRSAPDNERRDYLYFMAIGATKLDEFTEAFRYVEEILKIEPNNHQALELKKKISQRQRKEAIVGGIAVGAGTVLLGGVIALGALAISNLKK